MAVSFDLFGTLLTAETPADPAVAVATELESRGVSVPSDWAQRYARPHLEVPEGRELALPEHVHAALSSAEREVEQTVVDDAVTAAFDPVVQTRTGAAAAVAAAREYGPVAICSNCSVPGLVEVALERSTLEVDRFETTVSSVDCGWRKPAPEIFRETADRLGVDPQDLVHVGDDPRTDAGVEGVGGTAILLADTPLTALPGRFSTVRHEGDRDR